MDLAYQPKRLVDVARSVRRSKALAEQERWPRERVERYQRERIDAIVRHAASESPFYKERFAGLLGAGPVELSDLPTLDKATMMDRFDDLVTDRNLRRTALLEHLDGLDHDALYRGHYRVMTTSGSSGSKALFVYDPEAWCGIVAQVLLHSRTAGGRPRVPRLRMAIIGGGRPTHMSRRCAATMAVGIHRVLPLSVTTPIPRLVEQLNAFQPDFLNAYPSIAVLLAEEKARGRLTIAPTLMSTSSELRTPEMTTRIEREFGIRPFEMYATTEGAFGSSCEEGGGIHLYEGMSVVENVDEHGQSVPDGVRGARLLVTNLFNRVQPLIRFEVTDIAAFDSGPCPCGRTLRRLGAIEGRADDVLNLAGDAGRVYVHPLQFDIVTADRDVREFQVVQDGERLRLRIAWREGAPAAEASRRVRDGVAARLADLGVRRPDVLVETCAAIERPAWGKVQLVVADRGRRQPEGAASSASASSVRSTSASVV